MFALLAVFTKLDGIDMSEPMGCHGPGSQVFYALFAFEILAVSSVCCSHFFYFSGVAPEDLNTVTIHLQGRQMLVSTYFLNLSTFPLDQDHIFECESSYCNFVLTLFLSVDNFSHGPI